MSYFPETSDRAALRGLFWLSLVIAVVLGPFPGHAVPQAPTASAQAQPAPMVNDFYRWYLRALKRDHDPLSEDRVTLRKYVAPALIAKIARMMNSADGLESDYFLQAQDYLDEWVDDVTVSPRSSHQGSATLIVSLGSKHGTPWTLEVEVTRIGQGWKVSSVRKTGR